MTYNDFIEIYLTGIASGMIISVVPYLIGAIINVFFHIAKGNRK